MSSSLYRGSPKHKNRPVLGRKGTLCPEWTHEMDAGGYASDPFGHAWEKTVAHTMFEESEPDPNGSAKRYATMKGIAFVAQPTADGTWHGYPEPWNRVPADLVAKWQDAGKVTTQQLKRYKDFPTDHVTWALDGDDE
ncbi:hypothetical protein [Aquibium microcysteis]|uniref:hypothetical protein n=1 Tax=Aquibium microcysteis TaxID=675281 RepID=UPI00165D0C95|nr:hypothetical protein [Aquibium microcysteis]